MLRPLIRTAAAATLAVGALAVSAEVGRASTTQVTVEGVTYNLSATGAGTYVTFETAIQASPWWGDQTLAQKVANQQRLDSDNGPTLNSPYDLYAYQISESNADNVDVYYRRKDESDLDRLSLPKTGNYAFVTGTAVSDVPEIDGGSAARLAFLFGFGVLALKARRDRAAAEG